MFAVQVIAIHDPRRRPAGWSEIIGPGQFVAFATPSDGNCILFDSVREARAYCEAAVGAAPATRFDVFDAEGRAQPPLLTIVHPSQVLDTDPRPVRRRRLTAWALIAAGALLLIYTYVRISDIEAIFPGVIGINLLLAGGRILWFNMAVRETERARRDRLEKADPGGRGPA